MKETTICVRGYGLVDADLDMVLMNSLIEVIGTAYDKAKKKCERADKMIKNNITGAAQGYRVEWNASKVYFKPELGENIRCRRLIEAKMPFDGLYWENVYDILKEFRYVKEPVMCTAFNDARFKALILCETVGLSLGEVVDSRPAWNHANEHHIPLNMNLRDNSGCSSYSSPFVSSVLSFDFSLTISA